MRPDVVGGTIVVAVLAVIEVTLLALGIHTPVAVAAAFVAWLGGGAVFFVLNAVYNRQAMRYDDTNDEHTTKE